MNAEESNVVLFTDDNGKPGQQVEELQAFQSGWYGVLTRPSFQFPILLDPVFEYPKES